MKSQSETVTPKRRGLFPTAGKPPKSRPAAEGEASAPAPMPEDPAKRRTLIAEAAYYRAEKRGFAPGGELRDWLEAEAEIGQRLGR